MTKRRQDKKDKYESYLEDVELWESRKLGASLKYAERASEAEDAQLDESLGLTPISIRLQKDLVSRLKIMAKEEGLAYQAYIRQILTRHVKVNHPVKLRKGTSK